MFLWWQHKPINHLIKRLLKINQPIGVFLLAPALFMPDYRQQTYTTTFNNIEIVHGWSDDIIPVEHAIKYAKQAQCTLHLIDGDHRLNYSIEQVIELFDSFLLKTKAHHKYLEKK